MIVLLRPSSPDPPTPTDNQRPAPPTSRLLALPAELRTQIWSLLLLHDPTPPPSVLPNNSPRPCPSVALLRTCHQLQHEATPILYGGNIFAAHGSLLTSLPALLVTTHPHRTLGPVTSPRLLRLITRFRLAVRLDVDARFTRRQATEAFSGVAELVVDVFQSMYGSCDFGVLRLLEDVRGVGKAGVVGSVGDGRYAAWLAEGMMLADGVEREEGFAEEFVGGSKAAQAWLDSHARAGAGVGMASAGML